MKPKIVERKRIAMRVTWVKLSDGREMTLQEYRKLKSKPPVNSGEQLTRDS